MNISFKRSAIAGVALVGALSLSACGGSGDDAGANGSESPANGGMTNSASPSPMMTESASPMASGLVGPGCAAYAEANPSGPGSVAGMAQDPVAVAASNNPMLKTLTQAVSGELNPDVNLVSALNDGQKTVFAPVDSAFEKIDSATIDSLKTDDATLKNILTYHVVEGQLDPTAVVGEHKTLEGQDLKVTGSGDNLEVNGAKVVCGGVQTANATVYLIDTVLMPPAKN